MDFKQSKLIFLQIADRIMDEILMGVYHEEERIPSVREYAAKVEVNANTVVRSYDYLQQTGIIYNKRGIGYFVASDASEKILSMLKDAFVNEYLPEMFRQLSLLHIPLEEVKKMLDEHYANRQ